jgi:hypothetical protein
MKQRAFQYWLSARVWRALAVGLVLCGALLAARAAVPVGPTPEDPALRQQHQVMLKMEAEASQQQKLDVGKQRFDEKVARRQQILRGMEAVLAERKRTVVVSANPVSAPEPGSHGSRLELWAPVGFVILAALGWYAYHRQAMRVSEAE